MTTYLRCVPGHRFLGGDAGRDCGREFGGVPFEGHKEDGVHLILEVEVFRAIAQFSGLEYGGIDGVPVRSDRVDAAGAVGAS